MKSTWQLSKNYNKDFLEKSMQGEGKFNGSN